MIRSLSMPDYLIFFRSGASLHRVGFLSFGAHYHQKPFLHFLGVPQENLEVSDFWVQMAIC